MLFYHVRSANQLTITGVALSHKRLETRNVKAHHELDEDE
jgi:hypothetical protein